MFKNQIKPEFYAKILLEIYDTSIYSTETDYIFELAHDMKSLPAGIKQTVVSSLLNSWETEKNQSIDVR